MSSCVKGNAAMVDCCFLEATAAGFFFGLVGTAVVAVIVAGAGAAGGVDCCCALDCSMALSLRVKSLLLDADSFCGFGFGLVEPFGVTTAGAFVTGPPPTPCAMRC